MTDLTRPLARKLLLLAVALVLTGVVWSGGTWSAFSRTASSPGDSVATGSVTLTDNDGGSPLFALSAMADGTTATSCQKVTYGGTVPAQLRLFATTGGTGLAAGLTLTITRGTIAGTPAAKSCTGFVSDTTNYVGSGAGVIYTGTLAALPTTSGTALADPLKASPATWTAGDAHAYKVTISMESAVGAGKNATADFSWVATSA
jgi:hypothetical protein